MFEALISAIPIVPLAVAAVLGVLVVTGRPVTERTIARAVLGALVAAFGASLAGLALWLLDGGTRAIPLYTWLGSGPVSVEIALRFDGLALVMATLSTGMTLLAAQFSQQNLHAERRFFRFFFALALFSTGMSLIALADNYVVMFVGWELAGLCSYLLIGFYDERPNAARGAFRSFITARLGDVAFLAAIFLMGPATRIGEGAPAAAAWCLVVAAAVKSAQLPFTGWLPRAMEGPTPSSALFYGGIKVSAGVFLLLGAHPMLSAAPGVMLAICVVGGLTALHATATASVQTEAKSVLAWSSVAQLGLIFLAFGVGESAVALGLMLVHAVVKMHLFLTAPSLLRNLRPTRGAVPDGLGVAHWLLLVAAVTGVLVVAAVGAPAAMLLAPAAVTLVLVAAIRVRSLTGATVTSVGTLALAGGGLSWQALDVMRTRLHLFVPSGGAPAWGIWIVAPVVMALVSGAWFTGIASPRLADSPALRRFYDAARAAFGLYSVENALLTGPMQRLAARVWRFDASLERAVAVAPPLIPVRGGIAWVWRVVTGGLEWLERHILGRALGLGVPGATDLAGGLLNRLESLLARPAVVGLLVVTGLLLFLGVMR